MYLKHMDVYIQQDRLKVDIQEVFKTHTTIKKWAYILHDKDDTAPHYHIYIHFGGSSVDTKDVAKWFHLGYTDEDGAEHTGEQFIEKIKGRGTDALLYLTHGNASQQHKHQYSQDEVTANFDFVTEIQNAQILGDFEHFTYAQMLQYANTLSNTEKTRALNQLEKLWKLHCMCESLKGDRQIEVVFIYGKTGTGKTTYAKKLFEGLGYDYCVSSSSNDPFDFYLGQQGMLLDDLRDEAFSFEDFLKITDNHTKSSIKSRFQNKIFVGKMIIITSSVPLKFWYRDLQYGYSGREDLAQLYRRIGCYVECRSDALLVYDGGLDDTGNPVGIAQTYYNAFSSTARREVKKFDFCAAFDKIATPNHSLLD